MKNAYAIGDIARQIKTVAGSVEGIGNSIQAAEQNSDDSLLETYDGLLLNELENMQMLTIALTKLVAGSEAEDAHTDEENGSAFAAGDLTSVLGDKTEEDELANG